MSECSDLAVGEAGEQLNDDVHQIAFEDDRRLALGHHRLEYSLITEIERQRQSVRERVRERQRESEREREREREREETYRNPLQLRPIA